jgi:transposase
MVHGQALGYDFLHVAVDDHSRLAYVEALPDERDPTSAGFLRRATAWFADHGVPRARGPDQQRPCLPGRPRLDPGLRRARDQPSVHPPALPLDERESRTVQPDPAR